MAPPTKYKDPRRPEDVQEFQLPVVPDEERDGDMLGMLPLAFTFIAIIFKYPSFAWGSLALAIISLTTQRRTQPSASSPSSMLSFSMMALVMSYMNAFNQKQASLRKEEN
ncbi:hypothetical protein BC832DRAFT_594811 [Gaertneriomyces semiglobifer]|nr:hypothetical protein BC832DRAFT_594811 [Gaertneriomyces semiglobifer]